MASNYKQNFDYSEAIANTTDSATRQQLLTERQNKIDAEGLNGKVASNERSRRGTAATAPIRYRPAAAQATAADTHHPIASTSAHCFRPPNRRVCSACRLRSSASKAS